MRWETARFCNPHIIYSVFKLRRGAAENFAFYSLDNCILSVICNIDLLLVSIETCSYGTEAKPLNIITDRFLL